MIYPICAIFAGRAWYDTDMHTHYESSGFVISQYALELLVCALDCHLCCIDEALLTSISFLDAKYTRFVSDT